MAIIQSNKQLAGILNELRKLPVETEWVEFKRNNAKPEEIGEYISALSNSAALAQKVKAYMVWGVDDQSHEIIGTNFKPLETKIGNEALENWLLRLLTPKLDFHFYSLAINSVSVVLLEINAAFKHPVQFKGEEFVRISSYKKKLKDHPEKERALWRIFDETPFDKEIAAENINSEQVLKLLNYPAYFDLTGLPLPDNSSGILAALKSEEMITESDSGLWNITNFGALLFAKKLSAFSHLKRKIVRVVQYKGTSKYETIREESSDEGYAIGYENLVKTIMQLIPSHEVIEHALRKKITLFPELAVRELLANAMIHQNFHSRGTSIMVELFDNRLEVINPGLPLIEVDRFLDSPPKSPNEAIASFMRRINICEERGSGIDKIVLETERYHLPAPEFRTVSEHTIAILFSHKNLNDMDKSERTQACYLHACLKYVNCDYLTNSSIRERFSIAEQNMATASRIIKDTLEAKLIRLFDEDASPKMRKYVPYWA